MTENDIKILAAVDIPFECYDFNEPITLRQWFENVLTTLYEEDEGFSGKRPFGNSGWENYLAKPFVLSGMIAGDEDGYATDRDEAHSLVFRAIELVCGGDVIKQIDALNARASMMRDALEGAEKAMFGVLSSIDDYNEKNGTFLGGSSLFELGRQAAVIRVALDATSPPRENNDA